MKALKLATTLVCAAAVALLPSCALFKSVTTDQSKVESIAGILQTGTSIAVQQVLVSKPDAARYFKTAAVAIRFAVAEGSLTPDDVLDVVREYVSGVPGGANYAGLVEVGIGLALSAYRTFYEQNASDKVPEYLVVLLTAVADGIDQGVDLGGSVSASSLDNPINTLTPDDLKL